MPHDFLVAAIGKLLVEHERVLVENAALRAVADAVTAWREARLRCDDWVKGNEYRGDMSHFDAVDKAMDAVDAAHDALSKT